MPSNEARGVIDGSLYFLLDGTRNITGPTTIINNVPLLASDVLTIRGAAGQTGKLIVLENSALADVFTVDNAGNTAIGFAPSAPAAKVSILGENSWDGGLYIAPQNNRIINLGNVLEFTTGAFPTYTGNGFRLDGTARTLTLSVNGANTTDDVIFSLRSGATLFSNPTSGTKTLFEIGNNVGFTTTGGGSAVFSFMRLIGTINQTAGATGITRGLWLNPTITAAADWRSLEITPNVGYAIYQSGASAKNVFTGFVGLEGNTAPATYLSFNTGAAAIATTPNKIQLVPSTSYGFGVSSGELNIQTADNIGFYAGVNRRGRMLSTGLWAFGSSHTPAAVVDIVGTAASQFRLANTTSDVTNKTGTIQSRHYTNSEEDFGLIVASSTSTTSVLNIGGGSSSLNTATSVVISTAANNTTVTGTPRLTIDSAGLFTIWDGGNFALGTTTGTKFGTATTQKLGFFNATPIARPVLATGAGATVDNVITVLQNLGLVGQT